MTPPVSPGHSQRSVAQRNAAQRIAVVGSGIADIFPGGFLPSHRAILGGLTRRTSLNLLALDEIGLHYARTLREWRHRFEANLDSVQRLGYDECFIRMWRYYLCYCEGGFLERSIGTCHLLLAKPGARPAPLTGGV